MTPDSVKLSDDKKSIIINYSGNSHLILPSSKLRALSPSAEKKKIFERPRFFKIFKRFNT